MYAPISTNANSPVTPVTIYSLLSEGAAVQSVKEIRVSGLKLDVVRVNYPTLITVKSVMSRSSMISELADLNDQMSNEAQVSSSPSPTVIHTLQRHRDLLNDYTREFRKTKANLQSARDRTMLLSDVQTEIRAYKEGFGSGADYYASEQARLNTAHSAVDDAIGIAIATREDLHTQRRTFQSTSQRLQGIAETIPGLNVLMKKIDVRKRRDQLIIAGVIAVCLFISIVYTFG
ncbi:hypothetical protein SARC_00783 [Sphaeroforma arctica JP610]|uniref:Golgi SNAP receptor complex member 1 n=1 Tax=Sphaeroforma arctica JP610 TaxID=667725 RepID=A0A0L0GFR0_9EUKA|nr:hypothetical protein SARC_00783 [Sphaeroforma arctica JP610]KNC87108.1 hypothetical protein SARC_00783 [Sphaeroforma arctica JP610]|eukprot:XP_014161010.1 hypothetical protein SARC_00783 [Sphaeroforma arctica JP610]